MTDGDYTIVSNLSSFFTLRRDAISNAKKTPASSVASKNQTNQENDMWKTPVACEDNNRLHICLKDDFIIWRIGEWFFQETNKKNLPAPTKDPFATIWFP
jgi:hypothetical protein